MSSPEFLVPVHDLDAAGRRFRFVVRSGWVRGALEGTDVSSAGSDGELDVRASKSGADVVVRGRLSAELTVACARCLEPARVAVHEELSVLAVPASASRPTPRTRESPDDDADLVADQADTIPYDGERVVLDDWVRDELLLGIPMIPLCSEGCPGIRQGPSASAAEENIDPRLRPLLGLKKT